MHSGNKSCEVCNGAGKSLEDESGEEGVICPSDTLPKRSLELTLRLEEDALKVRESASVFNIQPRLTVSIADSLRQVVTLLTLLQGQASTENALKASEQSKILAVFTVITVVFVRPCLETLSLCHSVKILTKY